MLSNNKVFDVTPPVAKPAEKVEKEKDAKTPNVTQTPLLITAAVIALAVLGWFLIEPKAEIKIWPQKEEINLRVEATISGIVLETSQSVSDSFLASTTKLKTTKASGAIKVYNAYSTNAQPLIANTRFVSNDGKLFRITKPITVPGAHYEGGKLVPGAIEASVTADQPGEEYNIDPSTFSLPGLVGTASYTSIYAKSSEAMSGGMSKEIVQITQTDLDKAQAELTQKLREGSGRALEKMLPSEDYILLKEAITQKDIKFIPLAKAGEEVSEFSAQAKGDAMAMVFRKSDAEAFAREYLFSQVPADKLLQESSLRIEYAFEDFDARKMVIDLTLTLKADIYSATDMATLKTELTNKKPGEINDILKRYSHIEEAKVDLWPFWIEQTPDKAERIEIVIKLD